MSRWETAESAPRTGTPFKAGFHGEDPFLVFFDRKHDLFVDAISRELLPRNEAFDMWTLVVMTNELVPPANPVNGFDVDTLELGEEPRFTLVARDPFAPILTEAWAYLRQGRNREARRVIENAFNVPIQRIDYQDSNDPQILSAFRIAGEMTAWLRRKIVGG